MYKFSYEVKVRLVKLYLKGYSSNQLCYKYHVKKPCQILIWVKRYKTYGLKGLIPRISRHYSLKYKLKVIKWRNTHNASYPQTALHFNLSEESTIRRWTIKLRKHGVNGLKDHRYGCHHTRHFYLKMKLKKYIKQLKSENSRIRIYATYKIFEIKHPKTILRNKLAYIRHLKRSFKVPLAMILKAIGIPRSSYYYRIHHCKTYLEKNHSLIKEIRDIKRNNHNYNQNYGYRPVTGDLHNQGIVVNHKKVLKIMKILGCLSLAFHHKFRKYSSYEGHRGKLAPNRFHRKFKTDRPYQKLTTDVSDCRYGDKSIHHRIFFSPVMDLYSGLILSFNISNHPSLSFVLKSAKQALRHISNLGLPYRTTLHTDQGIQYQSYKWRDTLKHYRVFQSMSRKGNCWDNAPIESFFHTMKVELMMNTYRTEDSLIKAITSWIHYYNHGRIRHKLGWKTPYQYENDFSLKRVQI